jgi:hypothetical protein
VFNYRISDIVWRACTSFRFQSLHLLNTVYLQY